MKIKFFILIFIAFFKQVLSQAPELIWQHSYGGSSDDVANDLQVTNDYGFIISGYTRSDDGDITFNHGGRDYWVVKIDSTGEIEWQKSLGGSSVLDESFAIDTLSDGYIDVTGEGTSEDGDVTAPLGGGDMWTVKLTAEGEIVWERSYGGTQGEFAYDLISLQGDNFILTGFTYSNDLDVTGNHGNSDVWVVKVGSEGDIIWQKCFGGSDNEYMNAVSTSNDGGYILAGQSESEDGDLTENNGWADYWIIKIDSLGQLQWQKCFGGSQPDIAKDVIQTVDGGYLIAGQTYSTNGDVSEFYGNSDFWVLKLDSIGNLEWEQNYGGSSDDDAYKIHFMPDSTFLIAGSSTSDDYDVTEDFGGGDCWIICIDSLGNLLWQKSFGGSEGEEAFSIVANNNTITFAGWSLSSDGDVSENFGAKDFWVVHLGWCTTRFYADTDGDGYGDISSDSIACNIPVGYVLDSTDCNDENELIHPGAEDICDALDDNCNLLVDEDAVFTLYFLDNDADGYGDADNDSISCFTLLGFVVDSTDCNDENEFIYPGAEEICNNLDDDCDGFEDENLDFNLYFADADGDNYGNELIDSLWCLIPAGFVADSTDCDDTNPNIYPGAIEILNGLDDDCDELTDEDLAIENTILQSFKIFPNPADDVLQIEFTGKGNASIEIMTATSQIILSKQLSEPITSIDISSFSAGVYLIKIFVGSDVAGVSFVKE